MSFPYKKVVLFGATSGIGKALAERFIENGIVVIAIGRRKERLAELVQQHGHEKVQAFPLDVSNLESIPHAVTNLTSTYPDIDLVFLNAGVQYGVDFTKPQDVKMEKIQEEFTLNYLSQVALTKEFLPFLMSKAKEGKNAGLLYTTSSLALVPIFTVPNYCATKAAMHSFVLTLREQMKESKVQVLEIFPPATQTELHGESGHDVGMPLNEFVDEAWKQLSEGKTQVPVGTAKTAFEGFEMKKQEIFNGMQAKLHESPTVTKKH